MTSGFSNSETMSGVPAPTATTSNAEKNAARRAALVQRLHDYLKTQFPRNVLIPVRDKTTLGKWYGDSWTHEHFEARVRNAGGYEKFISRLDVAVVNKDWIVLDVDGDTREHGDELRGYFETRWVELQTCPAETTKKGAHYYFRRTPKCDELGLVGGVRPFREPDNPICPTEGKHIGCLPIDFLALASTGSGRIVVTAPSCNKAWLPGRAPWECDMPALPDAMAQEFARLKGGTVKPVKLVENMSPEERERFLAMRERERNAAIADSFGDVDKDLVSLVTLLKPERADSFRDWTAVGLRLKNAGKGADYFAVWEEFSSQAAKPDSPEVLRKKWDKLNTDAQAYSPETSMRALRGMARADNPEGYEAWKRSSVRGCIESAIRDGSTLGLARAFEVITNGRVVTTDDGLTFAFEGHRWLKFHGDHAIGERIVQLLLPRVEDFKRTLAEPGPKPEAPGKKASQEAKDAFDKALREYEQAKAAADSVRDVLYMLRNSTPRKGVISDIRLQCRDPPRNFQSRLDTDPDLIGFENGVVDLRTKEFRDGRPEDMISLSALTGHGYVPTEPTEAGIVGILRRTYPDELVCKYMTQHLAYCLSGHRNSQMFHIHTGSGANGKSAMQNVWSEAFGEYCYTADVALLTQGRPSSSAAQPDIVKLRGRRLVLFAEPEDNTKGFNMPKIKNLTGNDKITARDLYEAPQTFRNAGMLHLACNHLPALPKNDDAALNRLRVVPYESKFKQGLQQPNEDLHIYPADMGFTEKVPQLAQELMTLLIRTYETGMAPQAPDSITIASKDYFSSNSPLIGFKDSMMVQQGGQFVTYATLRGAVAEWKDAVQTGEPDMEFDIPTGGALQDALSSLLGVQCKDKMVQGKRYKRAFWGWALVNDEIRHARLRDLATV